MPHFILFSRVVIICSGVKPSFQLIATATGLELDVDDYVEKPVSPDTLLERVGRLIKRKEKV